jgi:hypothetical protein
LPESHDCAVDDRAELGVVDGLGVRLDEHELPLLVEREPTVADDVVALAGLADVPVGLVDRLHRYGDADGERGDDEREPAEDRSLAVPCAPATHPGRDVGAVLER